jgi:TatD DNase family protein
MFVVDSHCHLDFAEFEPERDEVVARARSAGVGTMLTISTRMREFARYAAIAERYPDVWCTVGTHPHQAAEEPDVPVAEYVRLAEHPRCVGIGEAGLDYHYSYSPPDVAGRVFRTQIAAARETGLPLVIHARDADADIIDILRDEMGQGVFQAVLHCFSSGPELARVGVELGLYVSFSGILTFRNSQAIRDIAADVPMDRLLVETDAPFLAPMPHRGKRNEPAFVVETCAVLASVKGVSSLDMAATTTNNFFTLFSKAVRPEGVTG